MGTLTCLKPLGMTPQVDPGPSLLHPGPFTSAQAKPLSAHLSPPFQAHSVPATNSLHTHLRVSWAQTGIRHRSLALKELTVC